jgi:hypothetical protein
MICDKTYLLGVGAEKSENLGMIDRSNYYLFPLSRGIIFRAFPKYGNFILQISME